jgi:ribonuclease T1
MTGLSLVILFSAPHRIHKPPAMLKFLRLLIAASLLGLVAPGVGHAFSDTVPLRELPPEARQTLALIKQGGPFPHARKDGSVFGNFEKRLPPRPRGYYREYTVPTPGVKHRGPRRIVAGEGARGDVRTSAEYYYTADHYKTFRRIEE